MKYLVPYDFTDEARSALDHARAISKVLPGHVELLHIISGEEQREDAVQQFADLQKQLSIQDVEDVIYKVRVGDIFTDISKEAEEGEAELMIMGTHGAKGLQKLFGSYAIKVITSSNTPFIITQKQGPRESINLIVLPVDLSRERVQVVKFASNLAEKFKAEIHLVCKPESDEFLVKKLQNNITRARQYMQKRGVQHRVVTLDGKASFHQEVINYGAKNRADLFAVAHFPESMLPQFERFSQELITNKLELPVLIVNARQVGGVRPYAFVGI